MTWKTWFIFLVIETAACLSPGPAVLLVLSQGLARGALASLWSSLGILSGNAAYFIISATSLGAVLMASPQLFVAVQWLGAAYLLWLGLSALFGSSSARTIAKDSGPAFSWARTYTRGFVLQVANPKTLVFFAALLPQFIDQSRGIAGQVAILGSTSIVVEFMVLACYGSLAARMAYLAELPSFGRLASRLEGGVLAGAAIRLALMRR